MITTGARLWSAASRDLRLVATWISGLAWSFILGVHGMLLLVSILSAAALFVSPASVMQVSLILSLIAFAIHVFYGGQSEDLVSKFHQVLLLITTPWVCLVSYKKAGFVILLNFALAMGAFDFSLVVPRVAKDLLLLMTDPETRRQSLQRWISGSNIGDHPLVVRLLLLTWLVTEKWIHQHLRQPLSLDAVRIPYLAVLVAVLSRLPSAVLTKRIMLNRREKKKKKENKRKKKKKKQTMLSDSCSHLQPKKQESADHQAEGNSLSSNPSLSSMDASKDTVVEDISYHPSSTTIAENNVATTSFSLEETSESTALTEFNSSSFAPTKRIIPVAYSAAVVDEREVENIKNETRLQEPHDKGLDEEKYMEECMLYCSLFPENYEFSQDTLLWSWIIAVSLIDSEQQDEKEALVVKCFNRLLKLKYILQSGYDHLGGRVMYKIANEQPSKLPYIKRLDYVGNEEKVEHLSLIFEGIYKNHIEMVLKCSNLKTLLLHKCRGTEFRNLLDGIFSKLKSLNILDLSGTSIEELPSSIENLKALKYLDMSDTPIRRLPESIGTLGSLETLILLSCLSLCGLPKCINKLIDLEHLVLDMALLLRSMPIGIGKLTKLQTLGIFVVGTKHGTQIRELGSMNKLKGSLCIMKLENILNVDDAKEARLSDKHYLSTMEFIWSNLHDNANVMTREEQVLECLKPHFCLQELKIVSYSGSVLPSWISDPSFTKIVSITLHRCRYCRKLPSLGELPSLKALNVVDMNELISIDESFYKKGDIQDQKAFPMLERLTFEGMEKLEAWTGVADGDFPLLKDLSIKYCPNLISLPTLSHMNSLEHLEMRSCPLLLHLPGLPKSLRCLMLKDCPELKRQFYEEQGGDRVKVASVPTVFVDYQEIKFGKFSLSNS